MQIEIKVVKEDQILSEEIYLYFLKIWDGFHHQFNLILILGKGIVDNYDKDTADQLKKYYKLERVTGKFDRAIEKKKWYQPPNTLIPSYGTFINPSVGDVEIVILNE